MEAVDVLFRVVFKGTSDDKKTSKGQVSLNMTTLHGTHLEIMWGRGKGWSQSVNYSRNFVKINEEFTIFQLTSNLNMKKKHTLYVTLLASSKLTTPYQTSLTENRYLHVQEVGYS